MNRKRILEWSAALGLLTGVVGLGTAIVQSNDARHKAEEQAKIEREKSEALIKLQQQQLEEQRKQFVDEMEKYFQLPPHSLNPIKS